MKPSIVPRLKQAAVCWGLWSCACTAQVSPAAAPIRGTMSAHSTGRIPAGTEQLTAQVDLMGILLGSIDSRTCSNENSGVVQLTTRMQSGPLVSLLRDIKSEAHTQFEPGLVVPESSEYAFREGELLRHYKVRHRPGVFDHSYDNGGKQRRTGRHSVPEGGFPHDLHSTVVAIRSWRPRLGDTGILYTVLGRRLWRVELKAHGAEVITLDNQVRVTFRIDGHATRLALPEVPSVERDFRLWLSEGAERVPLRLVAESKFGEVVIHLRSRSVDAEVCESTAMLTGR